MTDIFFFVSGFLAEVIGTIAGFGSSTIFLPLALLFFDFKTALVLVALFHIFGNISRVSFFKSGMDRHTLLVFGIPSVVLTLFGALLVNFISQDILKGILGAFLIFYAVASLWREDLQVKQSLFSSLVGGGISGFLAGLIGTGGALRGAFLTAFGLPKEKYIATAAVIALVVDLTRIPVYISQGFLQRAYYWYEPILLIVAIAVLFTGKQIFGRLTQNTFRKIVLLVILLIGIKFVWDFL